MLSFIDTKIHNKILIHLIPFLVFVAASTFSFFTYSNSSSELQKNIQTKFLSQSDDICTAITHRVLVYEQILRGAKGLFDANSNKVSMSAWHDYMSALDLPQSYPGLKGISFTRIVSDDVVSEHIKAMRNQGVGDYKLKTSTNGVHAPIVFIEPANEENNKTIGFDLLADPIRSQALFLSAISNKPTMTSKITLMQHENNNTLSGFGMCIPIYSKSPVPQTEKDRIDALVGFIYASFSGESLMRGVLDDRAKDIAFEIYDGKSTSIENRLYSSEKLADTSKLLDFVPTREIQMNISNHEWTIVLSAKNEFITIFDMNKPAVLFVLSELIFFAIFLILIGFVRTRFELVDSIERELQKSREKDGVLLQQSKMALMGEMLQNIAHQWRQPLNALSLMNYNLLLRAENKGVDVDAVQTFHDKASRVLSNMSRTIDDFRNFFQIDKAKKDFFLVDVVKSATSIVGAAFEHHGIFIDVVEENYDVVIHGYPNEFTQVLINIMNNAKDEMIKANTQNPALSIVISSDNNFAKLRLSDNGRGIDEGVLPRIFEPYFTTKESDGGTGIGLYMSKLIVEKNMSGTIMASNDNGAVFVISIPLKNTNSDTAA